MVSSQRSKLHDLTLAHFHFCPALVRGTSTEVQGSGQWRRAASGAVEPD